MRTFSFYKILLSLFLLSFCSGSVSAQIMQKFGDNSNSINDKAVVEIESTSKGFLLPRMTKVQRDLINNPPEGLMLWCTNCSNSNGSEIVVWVKDSWTSLLISNLVEKNILLGNADGKATSVPLSGDLTIDNNGLSAIVNNAITTDKILESNVTYSKIQNVNPNTILGRTGPGTGSIEEIATTGTLNVVLSESPSLSGVPTAPTAALTTNNDQIATTAFVLANQSHANTYGSIDASGTLSTSSTSDILMSGMSKSPEPGTYLVFFNSQYSISPANSSNVVNTGQAIEDLNTIYNEINNLPVKTHVVAAGDLGGSTYTPGVYSWGGAISITTDLTLDAENNPDAYFVFKAGGAFNTTAGIKVNLVNGASASNIYWLANGAIGIGAGCKVDGTLLSHDFAVAVGANCILEGRMLTTAGAIAFGPGTITVPSGPSFINFRTVSSFVALTAAGGIGNTGISTYNGDIATGLGAITALETSTVNGTIFPEQGDTIVIKEIDGNASFSLYQNGVQIPNSSRVRTTQVNTADITLQAIATVAQGENIDVRWNIDAGTLSVKNRILTVIKVQ
jgi:hypothetical protein